MTKESRVWVVEKRNKETLLPLSFLNIDKRSIIYSDGWASYRGLSELGYTHIVINHSITLGKGKDTTNDVESPWSQLKRVAGLYNGVKSVDEQEYTQKAFEKYLTVALWFIFHRNDNILNEFIKLINNSYLI